MSFKNKKISESSVVNSYDSISIGCVYAIYYFIILDNKKRKRFKFVGLCTSLKKSTKSFNLINMLNGEEIFILFSFSSPSIYKIEKLNNYFYSCNRSILKKNNRTIFRDSRPLKKNLKKKPTFSVFEFLVDSRFPDKGKIRYLKKKFRFQKKKKI